MSLAAPGTDHETWSRVAQPQGAALQTLNEFQVSTSNNSIPRLTLGNTHADELSLCEPSCIDSQVGSAQHTQRMASPFWVLVPDRGAPRDVICTIAEGG